MKIKLYFKQAFLGMPNRSVPNSVWINISLPICWAYSTFTSDL